MTFGEISMERVEVNRGLIFQRLKRDDQLISWDLAGYSECDELSLVQGKGKSFPKYGIICAQSAGAASDAVLYIADSDVIFVRVQTVSIKIMRATPAQNYESLHSGQAPFDGRYRNMQKFYARSCTEINIYRIAYLRNYQGKEIKLWMPTNLSTFLITEISRWRYLDVLYIMRIREKFDIVNTAKV